MIKDASVLAQAQMGWLAVRQWQGKTARDLAFVTATGGRIGDGIKELPYNLAFVFAYAVLNDVLDQLRNEGVFNCQGSQLGKLMGVSQSVLPWVDYNLVDQGRHARNQLAHDVVVIPRGDTWKYVDAVEAELVAWRILPVSIPFVH